MNLSTNFTLREMTRSRVAERNGIDNTPGFKDSVQPLPLIIDGLLPGVEHKMIIPGYTIVNVLGHRM